MPSLGWWFLAALMRHVQRYESDNCSRSGFVAVFLAFAAAAVSVGIVQPSLAYTPGVTPGLQSLFCNDVSLTVRWRSDRGRPARVVVYGTQGQTLSNVAAVVGDRDEFFTTISLSQIAGSKTQQLAVGLLNASGESNRSPLLQCPGRWVEQ